MLQITYDLHRKKDFNLCYNDVSERLGKSTIFHKLKEEGTDVWDT